MASGSPTVTLVRNHLENLAGGSADKVPHGREHLDPDVLVDGARKLGADLIVLLAKMVMVAPGSSRAHSRAASMAVLPPPPPRRCDRLGPLTVSDPTQELGPANAPYRTCPRGAGPRARLWRRRRPQTGPEARRPFRLVASQIDPEVHDAPDLGGENGPGQAMRRDAVAEHSTRLRTTLEDRDGIATRASSAAHESPGRPCPRHGDPLRAPRTIQRRQAQPSCERPVAQVALDGARRDRAVLGRSACSVLAGVRADATGHRGERVRPDDHSPGLRAGSSHDVPVLERWARCARAPRTSLRAGHRPGKAAAARPAAGGPLT